MFTSPYSCGFTVVPLSLNNSYIIQANCALVDCLLLPSGNHLHILDMTTVTLDSDVEAPPNRKLVPQSYQEESNLDTEEVPLFRRHQFDATESSSYFPEEGVMKELFLKESNMLRFKLYVIW